MSNAKFYAENDVKVQRQWPFVPKSDTTWDGILVSWKKLFWSNKNPRQSKTAVTQDYIDCSDLPESINGQNFDPGCPGAVYEDGSPSYSYCNGMDTTILTIGGINVAFGMIISASQRIFLIVLSCQRP